MKLFKTTNMEIIQLCQTYLCFESPPLTPSQKCVWPVATCLVASQLLFER